MNQQLFSKTSSWELHCKLRERLRSHQINVMEASKSKLGLKEMLFHFLMFQRPSSGLQRSDTPREYTLFVEKEDYERAKELTKDLFIESTKNRTPFS